MEENKNKSSNTLVIVLLLVVIVGLVGYLVYDKTIMSNENKKTVVSENNEKKDVADSKESGVDFSLSGKKALNDDGNWEYYLSADFSYLYVHYDYSKGNYVVDVNLSIVPPMGEINIKDSTLNITDLSGKVIDICAGGIGQDASNDTIFFLMNDGTVQYIPVFSALSAGEFKARSALNVSDVVRLLEVGAMPTNSPVGGHGTVLAQKSDGTFYNLESLIKQ